MPHSILTSLIGSRICHDLVNPLGAIGNGVELLEMTSGPSDEMTLIRDAVVNASAKLNFFRVAFGAAEPGQCYGSRSILPILEGVSAGGRHRLLWEPTEDVARTDARVAFLAIMCCESALPLGGTITVHPDWRITAEGRRIAVDRALWDPMLNNQLPEGLTGGQVHFGFMPEALAAAARSLSVQESDTQLLLQL